LLILAKYVDSWLSFLKVRFLKLTNTLLVNAYICQLTKHFAQITANFRLKEIIKLETILSF
jgi:hypothetical protein